MAVNSGGLFPGPPFFPLSSFPLARSLGRLAAFPFQSRLPVRPVFEVSPGRSRLVQSRQRIAPNLQAFAPVVGQLSQWSASSAPHSPSHLNVSPPLGHLVQRPQSTATLTRYAITKNTTLISHLCFGVSPFHDTSIRTQLTVLTLTSKLSAVQSWCLLVPRFPNSFAPLPLANSVSHCHAAKCKSSANKWKYRPRLPVQDTQTLNLRPTDIYVFLKLHTYLIH